MSKLDDDIRNISGRSGLVEQIKIVAEQKKSNYSWVQDVSFKKIISGLKKEILSNEKNWEDDDDFLQLIKAINNQIIAELSDEENKMTLNTQITIATGVLALIAISLYVYRYDKNDKRKSNGEKEKTVLDDIKKLGSEIKAGFEPPNRNIPQEKIVTPSRSSEQVIPRYGQYNLLLIVPAIQLDDELTEGSTISKNDVEKLISNTIRAYCFAENNAEGRKILNAIDCSEEPISYQTESRVFLQLSLSAKPEITKKRDKLGIREAIKPNQPVQIKTLKKMGILRSIPDFYTI